jgi:phosphate:Na+ symporter
MFFVLMGLIGGLALFLYGMQITSEGLKSTFGNKLKQIRFINRYYPYFYHSE